jgi:hypothetical protein
MLLAAIIYQVRFDHNLLIGLQKNIGSEFTNCLNASAGVLYVSREPFSVMNDTFNNPWWETLLNRRIRNPLNADSRAIGFARKLEEVIYDMSIIEIVHIAYERMRKVMGDGFEDLVLHTIAV